MTDEQPTRRKREDRVDRQALADAVNARMDELAITQAELARKTGVSVATIRLIQDAEGTRHYRPDLLSDLSRGLNWPADRLQRIFYRMPDQDPVAPSGVELVTQAMMAQLKPYLAKIDAMHEQFPAIVDSIHHVNQRIDAILDPPTHGPEDPRTG